MEAEQDISSSLINKIINEDRQKEKLYPERSLIDELKEKEEKAEMIIAERILGKITDKLKLAEEFLDLVPLYYDEALNWWKWDSINYYWRMIDETDILIMVDKAADVNVCASKERTEILNALKIKARSMKPLDVEGNIIQFDKELLNLTSGDRIPASSKYFVVNPIPFRLGRSIETPLLDKLFNQWVKPEQVQNLYEVIAYCLLPSYPIERIPCLLGAGANGKSTYLKLLYTFLGLRNICTTNLDTLMRSRFETGRLFKKLACIMAETNLSSIENSQLIKRLVSGKDPVSIEFKNKGLTEFINYAKIILATNNLPPTEDKTDGFYRRWLIIEFPNQFDKEVDVLANIPKEEYENLAMRCIYILDCMLRTRSFTGEGSIAERRVKYEEKSNPFDKFWKDNICEDDPDAVLPKWEFEKELTEFMKQNHVRGLSDRAIMKLMREKGISDSTKWTEWYENDQAVRKQVRVWMGIKWKN